jgi:hypothetical protein
MLKNGAKLMLFSSLALILMSFINRTALAAMTCTVNNQEVPCEELGNQVSGFLSWGLGILFLFMGIGIWATVFWIMMIVHAAKHDIQDRGMWIILMVFTGIIGAFIYYFVVKRNFNKQSLPNSSESIQSSTPPIQKV